MSDPPKSPTLPNKIFMHVATSLPKRGATRKLKERKPQGPYTEGHHATNVTMTG